MAQAGGSLRLPLRPQPNQLADALCKSCSEGNVQTVRSLLDAGAPPNSRDGAGWTALMRAVQQGHQDVVRLLLSRGADALARGTRNLQALSLALTCIDVEIARILLDHDASNIEFAPTGATPLHVAVSKGSEDMFRLLVEKGANPRAAVQPFPEFGSPGLGETALHMAVASWHDEMIPILLAHGLDVNAQGKKPAGQTPLHIAAWYGYKDAAKLLLDNGADINLQYADGQTALHKAAEHGHFEMVSFLLDRGADINASTPQGYTPLCAAAIGLASVSPSTKKITVELILERSGHMSDSDKARVLWSTATEGTVEGTAMLVEKGFPVDAKHKGFTGLDLAAYNGKEEVVVYFLKKWPVAPRPELFAQAIEMATVSGHSRIVGLLQGTLPLPVPKGNGSGSFSDTKIDAASLVWAIASDTMISTRRRVLANPNSTALPPIRCSICYDLNFRRGTAKDAEVQHYTGTKSVAAGAANGCSGCSMLRDCLQKLGSVYGESLSSWKTANQPCLLTSPVHGGPLLVSYGRNSSVRAEIFSAPGHLHEWPVVGAARDVSSVSRSDTRKAAFRGFLDDCLTKHAACSLKRNTRLPSRVIDVGVDRHEEPHLHIAKEGETGMYVTLSHCWGGHSPMTTTTDTLPARIQGIPLQSLPRTFRDAVIIARDLGVQYLWIDSLCILQDSADDWEREAARMSTIYANCYVMIAADASSNCDGGCFPPTEGPPIQASHATPIQGLSGRRSKVLCRITNMINDDRGEVCHRLYDCNSDWGPYPLDKRGWTLQERILAPRTLHFGQSEVGWECASRRACECQSVPTQLDTDSRWKAHLLNLPAASGQDPEPRSGVPDPQKQWIWSNIVEEFTTNRSLTYESDILPALAGLARTMSPAAGDDYMCGLWRHKLSGFLTWTPASSNGRRHKQYYAPSWSWASVVGPIKFPAFKRSPFSNFGKKLGNREPYPISKGELEQSSEDKAELLEVIDFQAIPQSASLGVFGPLRGAELIVQGPVAEANYETRVDKYNNPRATLVGRHMVESTCTWDIPAEMDMDEDSFLMLFVSESRSGVEEEDANNMVLNKRPRPGGGGIVLRLNRDGTNSSDAPSYSRVGTFTYEGAGNWKGWKEARVEQILRLV